MSLILVIEETEKDSDEYTGKLTRYYNHGSDGKDEKKFGWKMGLLNDGRKYFSLYLDKTEMNFERVMSEDVYKQAVSTLFNGLVMKNVTIDKGCQSDVSDTDGNVLHGGKKDHDETQVTQTLSSSGSETTLDGMTTPMDNSF